MDAEWTFAPYTVVEMDNKADEKPPGHIVAQNSLRLAFLIRCFQGGYFILEDVATHKRHRFESSEALLAELEEMFSSA